MEQNKLEKEISIKFTNRDKLYLSIIAVLILAIVILAIVLPRPYKTVTVEKPVDNYVYQKVYETQKVYIISTDSVFYDDVNPNYIDSDGNEYTILERFSFVDTGALKNMSVTVYIDSNDMVGTNQKKLNETLCAEFVQGIDNGMFGIDVFITSENMKDLADFLRQDNPDLDFGQKYLLKIEFENLVLNFIVTYVE